MPHIEPMSTERLSIPVPGHGSVTALRTPVPGHAWTFAYAPGAGSNVDDPFAAHAAPLLAARGIEVVRFQFPYAERGAKRPDPPPVLRETWRAVVDAVRPETGRLVVGGRSMGGRIASMAVAEGLVADALALLAYPLHPPGSAKRSRVIHLPAIGVPTLFCSGTRDAFGAPEELRVAAAEVSGSRLHLLERADHGFAAGKRRPRTEVWDEVADVMAEWLAGLA